MQITNLKLTNFRNYNLLNLNFSNRLNIFYGDNGSGKTNILESIYVLALTKSFRTINDKNIIKNAEVKTKVEGEILDKRKIKYSIEISSDGKKVKINNNNILKLSDYISSINVVLFNPNDLDMIKTTPSFRRKCLNMDLSQLDNSYLKLLNTYNKILKQRNSYLKTMYINSLAKEDYLNILTDNLIEIGEKIYQKRKNYIEMINKYLATKYFKITKISNLKMEYISEYNNFNYEKIKKKYKDNLKKDMAFGKTLLGVHHDDFKYIYDKINLKDYGSEGQMKNAVIAYKLSFIEIIREIKNKNPILLLDDLFSELDQNKIGNILKLIKKNLQVFITVTDLKNINITTFKNYKLFQINKGKVEVINYEA